jgi:uncharacterized UPF0160 family protein
MSQKIIATHNGKFHSDDVFAVATLRLLYGKENIEIVRSRDESVLAGADIVLDVGGVYDEKINRFDHHQKEGAGEHPETKIPYSSFGLIWKHFGRELVGGNEELWKKINHKIVVPIDALDNGIDLTDNKIPDVFPLTLHSIVSSYMPSWKNGDAESFDVRFLEAVTFAQEYLEREIAHQKDKIEGEELVRSLYKNSEDPRFFIMDSYIPYDFLVEENEALLYGIYKDVNGSYCVKAVHTQKGSFENRLSFPPSWWGKTDTDLENESGVAGATFCHRNGFIAIAKTRDAAIKLALNSIIQNDARR